MEPFVYTALPARVVFRRGCRSSITEEIERLGCKRAAVITTAGRADLAEEIAGLLGDRAAGILAEAVMHAPVDVSDKAAEQLKELGADCTVAVGGGSTPAPGSIRPKIGGRRVPRSRSRAPGQRAERRSDRVLEPGPRGPLGADRSAGRRAGRAHRPCGDGPARGRSRKGAANAAYPALLTRMYQSTSRRTWRRV